MLIKGIGIVGVEVIQYEPDFDGARIGQRQHLAGLGEFALRTPIHKLGKASNKEQFNHRQQRTCADPFTFALLLGDLALPLKKYGRSLKHTTG